MQYQLIFIILALFSVYSLSQIVAEWKIPTPKSSNTFLQYENPHVGYKVEYPDNWVILESNSSVMFYPLMKSNEGINQPSVYLTISNTSLPNVPISLEVIVEETINNFNSSLDNFKLLLSKKYGNIVHSLYYTYNRFNNTFDTFDFGILTPNNNFLLLSYTADSSNFTKYLPTVTKIMETFEPLSSEMKTNKENTAKILNQLLTPVSENINFLGNNNSKITIVEFGDYRDPLSTQFHNETKDALLLNFVDTGKAKYLFKDLIINEENSTLAAAASYCAAEQGMYWEYHDELFKNSNTENAGWLTNNNLNQFANNIRVPDLMKFSDCVDTGKYNEIVSENDSFARNIGLTSTPSFIFYNGTTPVAIQGPQPYEAFEQIITAIE